MTTSQTPARSVLRKKPRRCAHQVYSTRSPRSWANNSAILFSKPSPRSLENGRLFGSAQTRSTPAGRVNCGAAAATGTDLCSAHPFKDAIRTHKRHDLRKREHIKHASSRRVIRQVGHGAHEA